jgi:hypothetical protein
MFFFSLQFQFCGAVEKKKKTLHAPLLNRKWGFFLCCLLLECGKHILSYAGITRIRFLGMISASARQFVSILAGNLGTPF